MPNTINIPTPLRPFTDKKESVEVSGATVGELLADLTTRYEGLRKHLYGDSGKLRNFVNVYLNDEDIRYLQREQTPVKAGDTLSIVPSVAGGAPASAEATAGKQPGAKLAIACRTVHLDPLKSLVPTTSQASRFATTARAAARTCVS